MTAEASKLAIQADPNFAKAKAAYQQPSAQQTTKPTGSLLSVSAGKEIVA